MILVPKNDHQKGESKKDKDINNQELIFVEGYQGKIQIEWNPNSPVTPNGQMPFFIEFLKTSGLLDEWIESCPLSYKSNNSSKKREILGTIMMSVLSGHTRYSHISTILNDGVNPPMLGMSKVVSEDTVRRALLNIDEEKGKKWLFDNLTKSYMPLLKIKWILDVDSTVKPLYGKQECAEVGYNPSKPGKPSHSYHAYYIGNIRIILDVDVESGKATSGCYSAPHLWRLLDFIPKDCLPSIIRGDCSYSSEVIMSEIERRELKYLFKLKKTAKAKKAIISMRQQKNWLPAGHGFECIATELKLTGWSRSRKIVVLRKKVSSQKTKKSSKNKQLEFNSNELSQTLTSYEYQVLVTNVDYELATIAQLYRDRSDCENNFDEFKNQWGWCGYTTHDLKRNSFMARIIALVYNWWTIFTRLANPDSHLEAITSRPLLLNAIAKQTTHGRQSKITVTSTHRKSCVVSDTLTNISSFLNNLLSSAEQLTKQQIFNKILMTAFSKFLPNELLTHSLVSLAP